MSLSERATRKRFIDPMLAAAGWKVVSFEEGRPVSACERCAVEEFPTENGPADYALCAGGKILGIVEAKKLSLGPQNVLTQAERYARGATGNPLDYRGLRVPFLYATNGEVIWHHDIRHERSLSRKVSAFHTPDALVERMGQDFEGACATLLDWPNDHDLIRPYQIEANTAVEQAIAGRKRDMLIAMATGTGKTFTTVNQVYRLIKSGVAKRILFLVDRRALAAQAVRAFSSFEAEPGMKFPQVYELYSQRFRREDFGEEEKFDPKVLPANYLLAPKEAFAFVYVCTIQRMTINLFGREAAFGLGDDVPDDDADRMDIPNHAFDLIVADECHRGYTGRDLSIWRKTLDHFDAIKVGLTATPAAHTVGYFGEPVFRYDYQRAVDEGHLVDYDVVKIRSEIRMQGIFHKEGEAVGIVDAATGAEKMDRLEDEREFNDSEIESKVTSPDSNRKILAEIKTHADTHHERYGRFPKTLIFAANDLPHTSHCDALVGIARDLFGQGDAFVQKITGRADRPLQAIREFRNRDKIGMVVTVDMLSTGVDIPDLEYIVFLRPVKSRILFEQMLGRGTRRGERFPDKASFTVFDCFDGTLLERFMHTTGITAEPPQQEVRTNAEIIADIWNNRDRDYNAGCLVKRLHRIERQMSGDAFEQFKRFLPEGDMAAFASGLRRRLHADFAGTMKVLRDPDFQDLLLNYPRPTRTFLRAVEAADTVTSERVIRIGGSAYKPDDYLKQFCEFIRANPAKIAAIRILLERPADWSPHALGELLQRLRDAPAHFTEQNLENAHRMHYGKALVDIISMVKHAAREEAPLLTAPERVSAAFERLTVGQVFTEEQEQWLDHIRRHLLENLSIDKTDFEAIPVFTHRGGWGRANRAFDGKLSDLLRRINAEVAA